MREITECQIIFPPGKSKIFRISSRLTFDYERFKFNSEAELTGRRVNNLDLGTSLIVTAKQGLLIKYMHGFQSV